MRNEHLSRRKFLGRMAAASVGAWVLGAHAFSCAPRGRHDHIHGRLLGPDHVSGHRLRELRGLPAPARERRTDVLVVGGGVAGLAAAWRLRRQGLHDLALLELEPEAGGNARGGAMAGMPHPWGAHYLPVPDTSHAPFTAFMEEAGLITGYDAAGRPFFDELHLCHAPHERLQVHGVWQASLVPHTGLSAPEQAQVQRFLDEMEALRRQRGRDGLPAFAIPAEAASQDPEWRALDAQTMSRWLHDRGYDSPALRWYVDYCLRDDYGTSVGECSAWAGLHYFAARRGGGANAGAGDVLTWPEGNAWLVQKLAAGLEAGSQWLPRHLVLRLRRDGEGVAALALDLGRGGEPVLFRARAAVFAGPQMVARHVVEGFDRDLSALSYAPWLVANLHVRLKGNALLDGLAWDNVPYGRRSLGYVYAGQQALPQHPPAEGVLTWYEPLTDLQPAEARRWLLAQDYAGLRDRVMEDMAFIHPGIGEHVLGLDLWRWGHGMVRPLPGLVTGAALPLLRAPLGRIQFAHSDLGGMSIFEEAFHQGCRAADAVLHDLGA